MATNLMSFSFAETSSIRAAAHDDGTPWFVAGDLSAALGYSETSKALEHCKHAANLVELNRINYLAPATKWIPESDVYRLVMRSNMPNAEAFQDWVCEQVLPAIRKTGTYSHSRVLPFVRPPNLPGEPQLDLADLSERLSSLQELAAQARACAERGERLTREIEKHEAVLAAHTTYLGRLKAEEARHVELEHEIIRKAGEVAREIANGGVSEFPAVAEGARP